MERVGGEMGVRVGIAETDVGLDERRIIRTPAGTKRQGEMKIFPPTHLSQLFQRREHGDGMCLGDEPS
jgi:hypothetical protein